MAADASDRLIVFARTLRPGAVKTRLVPLLGPAGAAQLHSELLERTLLATSRCSGPALELHTSEAADETSTALAARHGAALRVQHAGNLGERMHAAFVHAIETEHCRAAVLIGSDCPALTTEYLERAFAALREGCDAVIGPAEDGGYVLIGLTRVAPQVFTGISWSTPTVLDETRARLRASGLRCRELETLWDVDAPADYRRYVSGLGTTR